MAQQRTSGKGETRSKKRGLSGLADRQIKKGGVDIIAKRKNANKKTGAQQNMPTNRIVPSKTPLKKITTKQLAELFGCQPNTIRRGLCVNGHYLGLRPTKLPNHRLLWTEASALQLLEV